jgi:hypothetical protein
VKRLLVVLLGVGVLASLAQVTIRPSLRSSVRVLCNTTVAVTAPADTAENTLGTCTVPANAMGPNGSLRVWTTWTLTSSANVKTFRVRFSGAAGTQFLQTTATTSAAAQFLTVISNRNATNAQIGGLTGGTVGITGIAHTTATVDTTAETSIVVIGVKATAGETLTLERLLVELIVP